MQKKMVSSKLVVLLFLTFVICSIGCKKNLSSSSLAINSKAKDPISPFVFNWETATYIPTNPTNLVAMPWVGQAGGVDGNIVSDYKSADGWYLVYNTFNYSSSPYFGQTPAGGLYFALYNTYRGLLRFYLYIPPGTSTPTSNITHGLSLYPSGSKASSMLNFDGNDITDLSYNKSSVVKTNNQQINMLGNWIACQYEIAYDPNISSQSLMFPNLGLQWNSQTFNISSLTLNGSQTGTLTGSITNPSTGFDPSAIIGSFASAALQIYGLSGVSSLLAHATNSGDSSFLSSISGGISGGLGNSVTGIFNAIFGGNSGNSQEVNLTMNTNISLAGSITNSIGITNPFFAIPGQSNQTTANTIIPNYLSIMGVFNLTNNPTVRLHVTSTKSRSGPGLPVDITYTGAFSIDNTSYSMLFNPVVASVATIANVKQQILLLKTPNYQGAAPVFSGTGAILENVGNNRVYSNISNTTTSFDPTPGSGLVFSNALLRVSFDVIPTNGSPKSTIVKTFIANIVKY